MTADDRHPGALLDAWLDDRLTAEEAGEVEAHLAGCERCRRQAEALRATVEAVRALPEPAPPAGLESRIRAALDAEDARTAARAPAAAARPRSGVRRRWPLAAAVLAAAAIGAVALWLGSPPAGSLPDAIETAYADLERGGLPAGFQTADPGEVERRWQGAELGFPARVFDLEAMGIQLAGGGAATLAGRPAAFTAYRGGEGLVVCWMFLGAAADLPDATAVRRHGGFEFHVYRRDGLTLVLWQEGGVLCALAGRGDAEGVIALAFAKAMAPALRKTAA